MLLCLRGKTLPLAVQFWKCAPPVYRRCLSSRVAASLSQRPAPLLQPYVFHLSLQLGLHTSSPRQKRAKEVEESVFIPAVKRHWQEIKKTPKPALVLGYAGTIPFLSAPLSMCALQTYVPFIASNQVLYGACILAFLGGVRWGYTLPDNSPAMLNWINLGTGVMVTCLALQSLYAMNDIGAGILGLILGFGVSATIDVFGMKSVDMSPISPLWYKWLRVLLTAIVVASLLATLECKSRYPELKEGNPYLAIIQPKKSPEG